MQPLRGSGLIVCDPTLVFAVIDALFGGAGKFHTRIEGRDFSPTEQRVIRRLVDVVIGRVQEGLGRHLPARARVPALGDAAAVRQHRDAERDRRRRPSFTLEIGDTSGTIHFCIPYATLEPIRDVLYSTMQGDANEPDRRWVNLLTQQIQSAEVELVAELAQRAGHGRAAARVQAGRLHRARPAARRSRPRSTACRCSTATTAPRNGKYALKVDQLLTSSNVGWLGEQQCPADNTARALPPTTRWPPTGPPPLRRDQARDGVRATAAEQVAPASFANFAPTHRLDRRGNDINMILDIPVQLTVELGRTRIPIKHILQLAQGSVVELEALAGEPMDVLVNGYLIAQGEVVVVNDKFGIRLTDIVTPSERMRRLSRG